MSASNDTRLSDDALVD